MCARGGYRIRPRGGRAGPRPCRERAVIGELGGGAGRARRAPGRRSDARFDVFVVLLGRCRGATNSRPAARHRMLAPPLPSRESLRSGTTKNFADAQARDGNPHQRRKNSSSSATHARTVRRSRARDRFRIPTRLRDGRAAGGSCVAGETRTIPRCSRNDVGSGSAFRQARTDMVRRSYESEPAFLYRVRARRGPEKITGCLITRGKYYVF